MPHGNNVNFSESEFALLFQPFSVFIQKSLGSKVWSELSSTSILGVSENMGRYRRFYLGRGGGARCLDNYFLNYNSLVIKLFYRGPFEPPSRSNPNCFRTEVHTSISNLRKLISTCDFQGRGVWTPVPPLRIRPWRSKCSVC